MDGFCALAPAWTPGDPDATLAGKGRWMRLKILSGGPAGSDECAGRNEDLEAARLTRLAHEGGADIGQDGNSQVLCEIGQIFIWRQWVF